MSVSPPRSFVIFGVTHDGRAFRPSDWADRLCGVMAQYRPGPARPGAHLTYSPYVMPSMRDGVRCVLVDARLHGLEPLAYYFLTGFASDNNLKVDAARESASVLGPPAGMERRSA